MEATKIKDGVYWVGALDWDARSFHGYSTPHGITYNAYLIIDEKITLIDNVKAKFTEELLARISSIIDPSKIEVIISNHAEPDHSGSLPFLLKVAPKAKVYAAFPNGVKILNAHYGDLPIEGVKNGDTLSIGKRTLKFLHAPMVHWPDNMVTYSAEDKILFSNDIFGQHYVTSKRFDSEVDLDMTLREAKKYYANIVLPYTTQAHKISDVVKTLDFDVIASSHGVIWRDHIPEILQLYEELINVKKKEKALVVYDTMWGHTEIMAKTITEAFRKAGVEVVNVNINLTHDSDLITELVDCKYIAVGSPTLNNNMLPPIAAFLCYMKGLAPTGLKYLAFGSYGWGGQSIGLVAKEFEEMKLEALMPPVRIQYQPKPEDLEKLANDLIQAVKA
jgi:flavorubredoxin